MAAISGIVVVAVTHLASRFMNLDARIEAQGIELRQAIKDQDATTANSIERLYILLAEGRD